RESLHARPKLPQPRAGDGRDGEDIELQAGRGPRRIIDQVRLRPDHDRGPGDQGLVVAPELRSEHGEVRGWVAARQIDDEHQGATPDDVTEEPVAEPLTFVRAL